jgi:hypothetical protein
MANGGKRVPGKYYHYSVEVPPSEFGLGSRKRSTNWAIGYKPNLGDKVRGMPHVNPHIIAAYDIEWQAAAHADKLNQEVTEMNSKEGENNE